MKDVTAGTILRITIGILVSLIGLVLTVGGIQLAWLGGSWYYLLSGLALVVSGIFTVRGNLAGFWIYLATFAATVIWSVWEIGGDFWAWIPRFVGPFVLLLLMFAVAPTMRPRTIRWNMAGIGAAVALVATVVAGVFLFNSQPTVMNGAPPAAAVSAETGSDWTAYAGDKQAQRYSSLSQINAGNVDELEQVWLAHTGDLPEDPDNNSYGAETTPLKVDDRLYLCSATNILIALDPATGDEIWRHDPQVDKSWIPYTAACRGVAYYQVPARSEAPAAQSAALQGNDAELEEHAPPPQTSHPEGVTSRSCSKRIIEGTLDGRLIAVDAETGERCSGFGENGEVSIKEGLGPIVPGMVSMTSPPTIVDDVIVTGHQVLDGQKLDAPAGVIKGFDAITGDLLWAWDMTHPDWKGLPPEGESYTRGTPNMWTIASGDDDLGLVYLPMGNSAVDYWSGSRTEKENAYSTSLTAIDVQTGKPAWSFQTVHKDVWDYDLGSQGTLVDYPSKNGSVPAIVLSSKQGDIYILDRETGDPLVDVEERPVPQGGVEPEERPETQPFSLFHTLAKRNLEERNMWGMSPIDQMLCRIGFRQASYDGIYTPPTTDTHWIQYPGYNGGSDWGGIAVDPARGLIIANYNDMPNHNRLVPRAKAEKLGWAPRSEARGGSMISKAEGAGDPQAGAPYAIDVNAGWRMPFTNLLCKEPPYGGLRVIDLKTGETYWDRAIGTARRNGPFGIPTGIPLTIGTPNNGGPLVTAGGLVFLAATTDNLIRAIDIETGKTVWQDTLPAGGQATPMTYEQDGRQYVVLMTGGHHFMETPVGDEIIAWALPE